MMMPLEQQLRALRRRLDMDYRTAVFIDTNVALECLALGQLPWTEIDAVGPILVLVTATVLQEVDGKKNHPRLGDHARRFNQTLRPLFAGSDHVAVRERPAPLVHLAIADTGVIKWPDYPSLDPSAADARIVAEVIHTSPPLGSRKVFVSQDLLPLNLARRHGLEIRHVDVNWLRPREQSEAERKAAALTREVATLKSKEPTIEFEWNTVDTPVQVFRVKDCSPAEREKLVQDILAANPEPSQPRNAFSGVQSLHGLDDYDASLSDRYEKYAEQLVPAFAAVFESKIELMYNQVELALTFKNTGKVQAESLLLEISAEGGWLNHRPVYVPAGGPSSPRIRTRTDRLMDGFHHPRFPTPEPQRGRHEVVVEVEPERSTFVQITCDDFRHGAEFEYRFVAWLDPRSTKPLVIEAAATAANLHGEVRSELALPKEVLELHANDLVDYESFKYRKPSLAQRVLTKSIAEENYSAVEFDKAAGS
jgi:hypothetical protein